VRRSIEIPRPMFDRLRDHLFQNELEQGGFIFAQLVDAEDEAVLRGADVYLVPPEGWRVQTAYRLEMTDEERARILKVARDSGLCLVDCHSHRGWTSEASFSPSDRAGVEEFAPYVRWKLDGRPYVAAVWADAAVDAVMWEDDFAEARRVDEIRVTGEPPAALVPTGSWFMPRREALWWDG
jgi:hypothetical protein